MSRRELIPREILATDEYNEWKNTLTDKVLLAAITNRMHRIAQGNFGDIKYIGDKIYELRLDIGPGYRIYYSELNRVIILLTNGGTKRRQQNDIDNAKRILAIYKEENGL